MPTPPEIQAILDRYAENASTPRQDPADERSQRIEARLDALAGKLDALVDKFAAPPGLRRSRMTALEKSDYIDKHGKTRYDALPW